MTGLLGDALEVPELMAEPDGCGEGDERATLVHGRQPCGHVEEEGGHAQCYLRRRFAF